ncbi:hypothetical protein SLEP1_g57997 [Rubroshorea leprosula]|uniref:Uncharacterized protein n=1 Tax=Rubroshorea leprosula TaxID=152421 RepID=A0AAV5MQB2_9ROSI|nr:hypothetical protein SLEP1_g57997 [Rubroshorea leprosula]
MLVIELVRSSDPASGAYTPANSVPASERFITLAMTYKGDIYFIPVLYLFFLLYLLACYKFN